MHIDHVGIATDDAAGLAALYDDLLDAPVVHEEEFGGMRVVFCEFDDGYFELLEPIDDESTIARYLETQGSGIHHVAVETDDIHAALDTACDLDIRRIDDEPRPGAWGHQVAFLHPKDTGGVLVEFVQH